MSQPVLVGLHTGVWVRGYLQKWLKDGCPTKAHLGMGDSSWKLETGAHWTTFSQLNRLKSVFPGNSVGLSLCQSTWWSLPLLGSSPRQLGWSESVSQQSSLLISGWGRRGPSKSGEFQWLPGTLCYQSPGNGYTGQCIHLHGDEIPFTLSCLCSERTKPVSLFSASVTCRPIHGINVIFVGK